VARAPRIVQPRPSLIFPAKTPAKNAEDRNVPSRCGSFRDASVRQREVVNRDFATYGLLRIQVPGDSKI
jgi:hypothetical protein